MDEYLEKSNSKVRHTIKNDRGRLIKNKVSIRKINYKTYYNEICELNRLSLYKMPKSLLQYILKLEKNNISDTIGFFKNDKLVQYVTILKSDKISYTIAGNMNESLREWSGIVNAYNIFLEYSINSKINIAYLGYECCEEKIRRGADKIFKYLYVPEL